MKILKFLMKPIEILVLLSLIAALIYFRSIIFHSNVNQYIDAAISYTEEQFDVSIPSHVVVIVEADAVVQVDCVSPEVIDVAEAESSSDSAQTDEDTLLTQANNLVDGISEAVSVINEKADEFFDTGNTDSAVDQAIENADKSDELVDSVEEVAEPAQPVPAPTSIPVDAKEILFMARQSFWRGNTHDSEALYLDLINLDDNDPDAYGELGNVYYTQGKWKQAGEAYYEAAVRLLAAKDDKTNERVSYLLRVIQGLDSESAEKLKNKIAG